MQIYGVRDGHAKTSVMPTPKERDSKANEVDSSSPLWSWLGQLNPGGSSLKMSLASSPRTKGPRLSQLSTKWKKAGIWGGGQRATLSTSVSPKTENVSSLSEVLEPTVPIKSLLTAAACKGIIRREEKNGRQVPPPLLAALKDTIRLWCNVGAASGLPEEAIFAPRYVPNQESIREAIQTDQYSVARNLTWVEWEKLMGFPAGWTVVEDD